MISNMRAVNRIIRKKMEKADCSVKNNIHSKKLSEREKPVEVNREDGGRVRKMKRLAELEGLQIRILHRISDLELSHLPHSFSHSLSFSSSAADDSAATIEDRLSAILRANAVRDFSFKRVPSDYYDWTLEARRDVLAAASIHHLCKSIVLVTTHPLLNNYAFRYPKLPSNPVV